MLIVVCRLDASSWQSARGAHFESADGRPWRHGTIGRRRSWRCSRLPATMMKTWGHLRSRHFHVHRLALYCTYTHTCRYPIQSERYSHLILNHNQTPPMQDSNGRKPAQDISMSCDCAGSEIFIKISSYSSSLNEAFRAVRAGYSC